MMSYGKPNAINHSQHHQFYGLVKIPYPVMVVAHGIQGFLAIPMIHQLSINHPLLLVIPHDQPVIDHELTITTIANIEWL